MRLGGAVVSSSAHPHFPTSTLAVLVPRAPRESSRAGASPAPQNPVPVLLLVTSPQRIESRSGRSSPSSSLPAALPEVPPRLRWAPCCCGGSD